MAQRLARRFTLWAHNSEVTRSKRVAGISSFSSFTETTRCNNATLKPLSWRAAYRRTTQRQSHVRIFDGYLFLIKRQALDRYRRVVLTGMAQRKRAGLITPRTYDRNILPVFFYIIVKNNLPENAKKYKE